eukprot:TRINITY_DN7605_c0_g1_i1.p1 TRINITY_DN7605_c0_g1~~TRINITY_DN7605_c0_g1_i1.p1  ORF type:complete len:1039 (-),score=258.57 TRINITY_DN7605_c0_g1_i1:145-3261(-)
MNSAASLATPAASIGLPPSLPALQRVHLLRGSIDVAVFNGGMSGGSSSSSSSGSREGLSSHRLERRAAASALLLPGATAATANLGMVASDLATTQPSLGMHAGLVGAALLAYLLFDARNKRQVVAAGRGASRARLHVLGDGLAGGTALFTEPRPPQRPEPSVEPPAEPAGSREAVTETDSVLQKPQKRWALTDMLARSFISHFNNAFLNTIESVRQPHLARVVGNLRDFAEKVPEKYRTNIQKALRQDGFLSFLLARAGLSLLCAKATVPRSADGPTPALNEDHERLATVVEELYIAAMLHAEAQWDMELKADGTTFMAVATSFVRHLADPTVVPLKQPNIQAALLGFDANPMTWTQYGLDLLGISFQSLTAKKAANAPSHPGSNWKVSLLGGDSLYATAQWAMANLDSRACRKLIAKTIAKYSDGQLRKRELLWNPDVTVRQYLDIEKTAGVAAFFGASSACAALVNDVDDEIADQLADFGSDIGLIVGLLKDVRTVGIRTALKLGRMTPPLIFAVEKDKRLLELFERKFSEPGDFEEAASRVNDSGILPTMKLVNRLGFRAAARLECLEESDAKQALLTLTLGIGCLPLSKDSEAGSPTAVPDVHDASLVDRFSERFDLKVENLKLRAGLQRLRSAERRSRERLQRISELASGMQGAAARKPPPVGLGLQGDVLEIDWLLMRGLERRAPLPERLDLEAMLRCIAGDQAEVQRRLLGLADAAESQKLKNAISEVFQGGGKRLRPALCHLVHRMLRPPSTGLFGHAKASEDVFTLSTAIEVIHTASLVHDDVLDDAETRRQRATVHRVFGPDVAVLSGDFLFAHASGLVESLENDEVTRLVSLVIEQFGHGELAQAGKSFDTTVSLFDYMKKSFYKTASLLAAACRASAVLSGPSREVCDVMYSYGFYLGIAFQIADDILDFTASAESLGKPACQDMREGVLTAPVILCLQGNDDLGFAPAPGAEELTKLINRRFADEGDLDRAIALVHEGQGVERAFALADKMANKALEALMLAAPDDSDARRSLAGLTRWAVRRLN